MTRRSSPPPLATLALVAVVVVAHAVELSSPDPMALAVEYGFAPSRPTLGTALSSIAMHDPSTLWHVLGNLAMLLVLGAVVEPVIGGFGLVALFVASGLVGCGFHLLVAPSSDVALVGCSGALMGLAAVGAVVRLRAMLAFVVSYVGLNVLALFVSTPLISAGVSVADHVGGFVCGVAVVVLARLRGVDMRLGARRAGAFAAV